MSDASPKIDEARDAAELSGRRIGNFNFLRRLGRGAMAEVYLAEQFPLKRWVALKILKPELANDEIYLKRFEREAQAAASLSHANIVRIYEVGHVDGLHYIVQEYVQGLNLRDWLARNGPPDFARALSIMRQVAGALSNAAERGVVHRDIKPENIMVTASGEVKVADFGLARVVHEKDVTMLTQVGITMGTPLYMSPEQVEGHVLDPRSDLYSFGVTCYHMLTGNPPFVGDTALAVAVQHVKNQAEPIEVLRPDLPPALCRVVHQMLAKDPDHRWQSANELLRELYRIRLEYGKEASPEELSEWEATGAEPATDPRIRATRELEEAMRTTSPRPNRGAQWLFAAAMCGAFLLSGFVAWTTMRPAPLISTSRAGPSHIPRYPTVLRQWYYASQIGTEEAWQSVIDFFPDKEYYVLRAKQQLGRIYLREGDYERAMAVFDELAATGDGEFRAFGLAGKCGVLSLEREYRKSADVLDELWQVHQELRDVQMRKMLDYVIKENRSKLGPQTVPQWDDWLNEQFRPDG